MVVFLQLKVRSLTMLLLARPIKALPLAEIPTVLQITQPITVASPTVNPMQQWVRYVEHLPSLVPVELIIIFCFLFLILFFLAKMAYRHYRQATVRTVLQLEIGNGENFVTLPVISLPHPPNSYRFLINQSQINLNLTEMRFSAYLCSWTSGITLMNLPLEMLILLPTKLTVGIRQMKLLKAILSYHHYAVIHVLEGRTGDVTEMVVLKTYRSNQEIIEGDMPRTGHLYPSLETPT